MDVIALEIYCYPCFVAFNLHFRKFLFVTAKNCKNRKISTINIWNLEDLRNSVQTSEYECILC